MYWLHRTNNDLAEILIRSFIEVNNAFANAVAFDHRLLSKEHLQTRFTTGCTATVCLLRNSLELVVANVGDSRALLCRNGVVHKLTQDHGARQLEEQERIYRKGGSIIHDSTDRPMVDGRLEMTRSLGDLELKSQGVTAHPYTFRMEVKHGSDAFVILTTDGVTCVMSNEEVCDVVNSCYSPQEAAESVVDQAMHFGSQDNATSLVMPFGAWGKYKNIGLTDVASSFGRNLQFSRRF